MAITWKLQYDTKLYVQWLLKLWHKKRGLIHKQTCFLEDSGINVKKKSIKTNKTQTIEQCERCGYFTAGRCEMTNDKNENNYILL